MFCIAGIAMVGSVVCALGPVESSPSDDTSAASGGDTLLGIAFATGAALANAIYIMVSSDHLSALDTATSLSR